MVGRRAPPQVCALSLAPVALAGAIAAAGCPQVASIGVPIPLSVKGTHHVRCRSLNYYYYYCYYYYCYYYYY